jgi:3'-5' exoribonuclease
MVLLKNLKPNESVDGRFVVKFKKPVQPYAKGYRFELRIGDTSREVMLKYWGGKEEKAVKELYDSIKKDDVVFVKGVSAEYHNDIEISINETGQLRVCQPGEYDPKEFVPVTERDIGEMLKKIQAKIDSVKNQDLKKVLKAFFADKGFVDAFKKSPAAMYKHHGRVGGLLEHTLDVTEICDDIVKYHPELDRDLVITGAIIHDIGKIKEFDVTTNIKTSTEGMLIGHITTGLEMFHDKTRDLDVPKDLKTKLKHMIISHHGQADFGSPKPPAFPEAMIVHLIDYLDSTLEQMITHRETAETEDDYFYTKDFGNIYLR